MMAADSRPRRRIGRVVAWLAVALATVLFAADPAAAAAVSIHDDSHVLDVSRVQNEAATLPDPVAVYTTTKLADDKAAFDREAQAKVTGPTVVVIAVNTQSHHLAIRSGPKSRVTQGTAAAATAAFVSSIRSNSDYTAATIAALDSIRNAIGNGTKGQGAAARTNPTHSSGASLIAGLVCLLLVVLAVAVLVMIIVHVSRRTRQPRRAFGPPSGYNPTGGYGQPAYGPPPGYGQAGRSGVNPWVAGGAGAAAGGLLGYELGRMEGEHEERSHEGYSDHGYDDSGYGSGGGADGDFGDSGGGGDF